MNIPFDIYNPLDKAVRFGMWTCNHRAVGVLQTGNSKQWFEYLDYQLEIRQEQLQTNKIASNNLKVRNHLGLAVDVGACSTWRP
jgi:hypothetical protein